MGARFRLDAGSYSLEARKARAELVATVYPLAPLLSLDEREQGLAVSAHNAFRFARIYVKPEFGVPFLSSADIIALNPERDRFLSRKLSKRLDHLMVQPWDVLITCSGTVGNASLAPLSWSEFALSQHAIRLRATDADTAGYLTCFLRSRWGRAQLVGERYGSVVTHIEPHHLTRIVAPKLPPILKIEIGRAFVDAAQERDDANRKLAQSEKELLNLLDLSKPAVARTGPVTGTIRAGELAGRFEAAYHNPHARALEAALVSATYPFKRLGDPSVGLSVRAVTKFRKRVYVKRGGIPMLSSKQLFQVDPIDVKRLARGAHLNDLPEIELAEHMLCVTCSGTIGRVLLVPAYMAGWTANQHALRIVSPDPTIAAYIYAWLASDYGHMLLSRERYGSVIQELDRFQLAHLPLPWLSESDRELIAEPVLAANALRTSAWNREQKALKRLAELVTGTSSAIAPDAPL